MKKKILDAIKKNSILHGAYMAAGAAIATATIPMFEGGSIPTSIPEIKGALLTGVSAGVLYILKNVLFGSSNTAPEVK